MLFGYYILGFYRNSDKNETYLNCICVDKTKFMPMDIKFIDSKYYNNLVSVQYTFSYEIEIDDSLTNTYKHFINNFNQRKYSKKKYTTLLYLHNFELTNDIQLSYKSKKLKHMRIFDIKDDYIMTFKQYNIKYKKTCFKMVLYFIVILLFGPHFLYRYFRYTNYWERYQLLWCFNCRKNIHANAHPKILKLLISKDKFIQNITNFYYNKYKIKIHNTYHKNKIDHIISKYFCIPLYYEHFVDSTMNHHP